MFSISSKFSSKASIPGLVNSGSMPSSSSECARSFFHAAASFSHEDSTKSPSSQNSLSLNHMLL